MTENNPNVHQNVYAKNAITGATPNPVMPNPDEIDVEFVEAANRVLSNAVELIRVLVGAHQSAIAIIVQEVSRPVLFVVDPAINVRYKKGARSLHHLDYKPIQRSLEESANI